MFVCRAEGELNLDEFETDLDYQEGDNAAFSVDIQNVATNFVGEHDCIFDEVPTGLRSEHLTLLVTMEANAANQIDGNNEFKAEIIVDRATTDSNQVHDDVYVNCPKSGNTHPKSKYISAHGAYQIMIWDFD